MADLSAIRDKIKALRAKTLQAGCTEAEAAAAAEAAFRLMDQHGLDPDDVDKPGFVEAKCPVPQRRNHMDRLINDIAFVCNSTAFLQEDEDGRVCVYFGRDPNPEIAAYLHDVCFRAMREAVTEFRRTPEYRRKRLQRTRNELVRAFTEAMVPRLGAKLREVRRGVGWNPHQALKLCEEARDERDRRWTTRPARPIKAAGKGQKLDGARQAGRAAGAAIEVNDGIANSRRVAGLLGR